MSSSDFIDNSHAIAPNSRGLTSVGSHHSTFTEIDGRCTSVKEIEIKTVAYVHKVGLYGLSFNQWGGQPSSNILFQDLLLVPKSSTQDVSTWYLPAMVDQLPAYPIVRTDVVHLVFRHIHTHRREESCHWESEKIIKFTVDPPKHRLYLVTTRIQKSGESDFNVRAVQFKVLKGHYMKHQ